MSPVLLVWHRIESIPSLVCRELSEVLLRYDVEFQSPIAHNIDVSTLQDYQKMFKGIALDALEVQVLAVRKDKNDLL